MIFVIIYLFTIVLANFVVYLLGPPGAIFTAFFFIGLDLTLRDKLHETWSGKNLWLKMFGLILAGSIITFSLNVSTFNISLASVVAFASAAIVDTIVYSLLFRKRFLVKSNASNIAGAAADSFLFPTLAFGVIIPWVILGQFAMKVVGGFIWTLLLVKMKERRTPELESM